MTNKLTVLDDKGYVILHDVMGSDLTVANAARVSYDKKSAELTEGDRRLIAFLAREGHTSPFRHATMQFELYSPLMVARQHFKYIVGSSIAEATGDNMDAWNESSRRYITEEAEFYVPKADEWRSKPEASIKQGSGEPVNRVKGGHFTLTLEEYIKHGEALYDSALEHGIAPEQARLFLPAYGLYVRFRWTATLQTVAHLIRQRTAPDAQYEFRLYAEAVKELAIEKFPVSLGELLKEGD